MSEKNSISSTSDRLNYLDALRGIASLMVVVYHFMGWRWENKPEFHWGAMLFNGSDAVSFFFVLSGLVLAYPYFQKGRDWQFQSYYVRRVARLFPGFWVAVLMNYMYVHRHELPHDFMRLFVSDSIPFWRECMLVKGAHTIFIPGWTLGVEMTMSLLLPLLIIAVQKEKKWLYVFPILSLIVAPAHLSMFSFHFSLGLLLAYFYKSPGSLSGFESWLQKHRYLILPVLVLLFSIRHIDRLYPLPPMVKQSLQFLNIDFFHFTGLASCGFLYYILRSPKTQQVLSMKPLVFLGHISYSLYLCHWVVVVHIMNHWEAWQVHFRSFQQQYFSLLAVYLLITSVLSYIVYRWVEKPFIAWARKF